MGRKILINRFQKRQRARVNPSCIRARTSNIRNKFTLASLTTASSVYECWNAYQDLMSVLKHLTLVSVSALEFCLIWLCYLEPWQFCLYNGQESTTRTEFGATWKGVFFRLFYHNFIIFVNNSRQPAYLILHPTPIFPTKTTLWSELDWEWLAQSHSASFHV